MDLFSFIVLGCTLLGPLTIEEMEGKDELNMMEWPPYSSIYFAKDIPTSPYKLKMELNAKNVIEVLNELLPYIEADGGFLEFVEIDYTGEGGVVKVRLGGACSTCAMSSMTLKQGIEKKLMMEIPDIKGVVQVL